MDALIIEFANGIMFWKNMILSNLKIGYIYEQMVKLLVYGNPKKSLELK